MKILRSQLKNRMAFLALKPCCYSESSQSTGTAECGLLCLYLYLNFGSALSVMDKKQSLRSESLLDTVCLIHQLQGMIVLGPHDGQ